MAESTKICVAVDAMGGDFAPAEQVKGAVEAIKESHNIYIKLFGNEELLNKELSKYDYDKSLIEVVPTFSVIENCDVPTTAIRHKKDSSMVMGLSALKNGDADAFVSCGSTGALLVGGQTIVGRLNGVERAGLAFIVPSIDHPVLIMDCGANVDARPEMILQFAQMGSVYMKTLLNYSSPRVGIINIGEEDSKGNKQVQETIPLLKDCNDINFIGSVESRGITEGIVDVAVCDGFIGNIVLKMYEGVAGTMLKVINGALITNLKTKIGALLIKNNLKQTMKQFSIEEYGGAPMLGLKGFVVKPHGSSKSVEIKNTILQCEKAVRENLIGQISQMLIKKEG